MLLPQTAEYALRAMACLAALGPDEALRAKDLAAIANVPLPYLQKVLRRLVTEGLLVSRKGHRGGFALARPAAAITYDDVLRAAEFQVSGDRCAFGWGRCSAEAPCPLHPTWSRLKTAFHDWARQTTLADVDLEGLRGSIAAYVAREDATSVG